jgi:hypothetical protein
MAYNLELLYFKPRYIDTVQLPVYGVIVTDDLTHFKSYGRLKNNFEFLIIHPLCMKHLN